MTFDSVVCWHPEDIDAIAPIDVASIEHDAAEDSAVFVATHQPVRLLRLARLGATGGKAIDEHELLQEFTTPVGNDPQITVITGAAGTGKSHMVKWLHAHCADRDDWHQVYIEKRNTNLRRVIETILAGLEGPKVHELREKLQVASSSIRDLGEAKSKVLHELAHFVEFPSSGAPRTTAEDKEAARRLAPILNDPVLSKHLLRPGGAVHRIARLGLEGLQPDENEQDLFFRADDLPLHPEDLEQAAKPSQEALVLLARSERLRNAAIALLNQELAPAKAAVFIGTGVELTTVFDEVRKELWSRKVELVLYIEDLVLLHGIDRELAQVFTEVRSSERCGMRVAIAVTEGYLTSGLDTLTTRARHYSLNLRLGAEVSDDQARTFVGRYLNAIRLGVDRLRSAQSAATDEEWLPNKCTPCDYRETCHSGFGADANGFGYYPFNEVAVDRLVRLASAAGNQSGAERAERFDPREILRYVVRDPLREAAVTLPEGRFPDGSFAAVLDPVRRSVSVDLRARLQDDPEGDRRLALLGFWAPEPVRELVNVSRIIHTAFRLPELGDAGQAGGGGGGRPLPPPPLPGPKVEYPEVDDWANEAKVLPAAMARRIRQYVYDAVIDAVALGATGMRVLGTNRNHTVGSVPFDVDAIRIDAAGGGGGEVERLFEIEFKRSPKTAVLFKALLDADAEGRWATENVEHYVAFIRLVDHEAARLVKLATKRRVDLRPAIGVLSLTSQPGLDSATTAGERLEYVLGHQLDDEPRSIWRGWHSAAAKARAIAVRSLEQSICGAKGDGASSFLDAATIAGPIDRSAKLHHLGTLQGSEGLVDSQRRLSEQQDVTAKKVWAEVDAFLERLSPQLATGVSWERLRKDVDAAVEQAHTAALLPVADARDELAALADAVPADAVTIMANLRRKAEPSKRELWDLVPDPVPTLEALTRFCERAGRLLDAVEATLDAEQDRQESGIGIGTAVVGFRELADAIERTIEGKPDDDA